MENDVTVRNKKIKNGVKCAVLFVLCTLGLSQLLGSAVPDVPARVWETVCILLGALIALRGDFRPEKGTLFEARNKMSGTGLVVILGAFMAAKLLSMLPSALVALLFVNNSNADAMTYLGTIQNSYLLSFLFLGIATPFAEEVVFRGCIGRNYRKYGLWFAWIMSSVLFALYHCNFLQLVSTFLPGMVLFYVAMNYGIVWSMLLHLINNGVLAIGMEYLRDVRPDTFFSNYGEYLVEGLLIIAALLLLKKNGTAEKVKAFIAGGPENEKGVYKAAMGNGWFIVLVLVMAAVSAMMLFMLNGGLTNLPTP